MPPRPNGFYIVSDGQLHSLARPRPQQLVLQPLRHHELCRGCLIADVPAIVGSLDIVMGEIDR